MMQQKDGPGWLLKKRLGRQLKKHNKRNDKYTSLYDQHEQIKMDTVEKIDAGEVSQADVDKVSKQLEKMRKKMASILKKDEKKEKKVAKLMGKS